MRKDHIMNTIVIGGGQAGITLSYFLQQRGIEHLVLERDRAFSAWHNCWDSFQLNTANWMNTLPGMQKPFAPHKAWYDTATREEALDYFCAYRQMVNPPLKEGVTVTQVAEGENTWHVHTDTKTYHTTNVAICTGHAARPFVPDIAKKLPPSILQLHSSAYRNPDQITTANVLIVGSGSSGIQICLDLAQSDQFENLSFALSGNGVVPWSILGIPIGVFSRLLPIFEIQQPSLIGRRIAHQWQGGDPAMAPSPRWLSKHYGVQRVGRVIDADHRGIVCANGKIISLKDLTVLWCTGFRPDYAFIRVHHPESAFDKNGPIHTRGVCIPGLFFVGLKFQHTVGSHLLRGVGRDAEYIAQKIAERNRRNAS